MPGQNGDVFGPLTEVRYVNADYVETIEQVRTQKAFGGQDLRRLREGRDDEGLVLQGLCSTDPLQNPALQNAQKGRLLGRVEHFYTGQAERSVSRRLENPPASRNSSGRAFFHAEEVGLKKFGGHTAGVPFQEGRLRIGSASVKIPGKVALPGPRSSYEYDRAASLGRFFGQAKSRPESRIPAQGARSCHIFTRGASIQILSRL